METTVKTNWVFAEATTENINKTIENIIDYAKQNDYQIKGDFTHGQLVFSSKSQKKTLRHLMTKLNKKITLRQANWFLGLLYEVIYKFEKAPYIEISEKEKSIQAAKTEWKNARDKAELALKKYKETKGDFYKK